ncbi:MAG TPA: hypothetical protein VM677_25195 [Actinokineospora sp.]|jgi:hypothetical protein|nr:hypothetical protein [Actinokineospora sp.]
MNGANWDGADDGDPFATGGHGRFMKDGAAPAVIGAVPGDDVDETVRVDPAQVYDREPPTSPIPVAAAAEEKKGFFARIFSSRPSR